MILALVVAASVPVMRFDPTDRALPVSASASAIGLFRQTCFEPFPSADKAAAAIAARSDFTPWKPGTDMEAQLQAALPSRIWFSQTATVRFIARGTSAHDLPDPQCSVMATVSGDEQPEALFSQMAAELRLPAGKVGGKKRFRTSMWDISRPQGQRWRVILGTQSEGDGLHLRLSMLNLAPEPRS
ncbi:hypothetical protein BH10PSE12_BH10PSE12_21640 [soil metagenome]